MELGFWSFLVLGLLALVLLMLGLTGLWMQNDTAQDRLQAMNGDANPSKPANAWRWLSVSPSLERWLGRLPRIRQYDLFLQQTGWPLTVAQVLLGCLSMAVLLALGGLLLGLGTSLVLLLAVLPLVLAQALLVWQRARRTRQLEEQLPDALDLIARSMQAGHAFTSALQIAARESPSPMGRELAGVFSTIQYGAAVVDALGGWANRVAGDDVRIFVTGVRIQTETGGNLAELMQQTASLIRERQKLRGSIRVLSAEGRISALILTVLPFVVAGLMTAINPLFMDRLWHEPLGQKLVAGALLLMLIGVLWMWQMVRIRP